MGPFATDDVQRVAIPHAISQGRIVAIARGLSIQRVRQVAELLALEGLHAIEITLNTPDAYESIAELTSRYGPDELLVGAGTVLSVDEADRAHAAGARFLVMPHLDERLVKQATDHQIASFPGAMTPTEILRAWRAGASAVKIFPASVLGPRFVRELRGPLTHIPVLPTGGIDATTAGEFLSAGATAVAVGSWLTSPGDSRLVRARARELIESVSQVGRGQSETKA